MRVMQFTFWEAFAPTELPASSAGSTNVRAKLISTAAGFVAGARHASGSDLRRRRAASYCGRQDRTVVAARTGDST